MTRQPTTLATPPSPPTLSRKSMLACNMVRPKPRCAISPETSANLRFLSGWLPLYLTSAAPVSCHRVLDPVPGVARGMFCLFPS